MSQKVYSAESVRLATELKAKALRNLGLTTEAEEVESMSQDTSGIRYGIKLLTVIVSLVVVWATLAVFYD